MSKGWPCFPEGETEDTAIYTLTVYKPPRPSFWKRNFDIFAREGNFRNHVEGAPRPPMNPVPKPKYGEFKSGDLDGWEKEGRMDTLEVDSNYLLSEWRCSHIQGGKKVCAEKCYVLEKGKTWERRKINGTSLMTKYPVSGSTCTRIDCEGHAYQGPVMTDKEGRKCFGEKGKRLVCIDRSER